MAPGDDAAHARGRPTQFAWTVVAVLYALVVLGGVVTATDSGMGCGRHWPLCAGELVPPATLHGVLEWSHRFVAGVASVLMVLLAVSLWRSARRAARPVAVRRLSAALVGTLALQVVLGGLVVLNGIPPWLIALHEGAALLLLDMAVTTALWLTTGPVARGAPCPAWTKAALWALAAWAGLTSMLGSYLAHLDLPCRGLADCLSVMARAGGSFGAGLLHWLAALALGGGLIVVLAGLERIPRPVRRWLWWSATALGGQAVVGVLLLASGAAPAVLALHEAVGMAAGALLWGTASTVSILEGGTRARAGRRGVSGLRLRAGTAALPK